MVWFGVFVAVAGFEISIATMTWVRSCNTGINPYAGIFMESVERKVHLANPYRISFSSSPQKPVKSGLEDSLEKLPCPKRINSSVATNG